MAYATEADAIAIHGADYVITSCDRTGDGTLDSAAFARHLNGATDEIDSYLYGRVALPLLNVPRILVIHCVNMAIASACAEAGPVSTRKLDLEAKAIKFLEDVQANKRKLISDGAASTGPNLAQSASISTAADQVLALSCGSRRFTRDKLDGL